MPHCLPLIYSWACMSRLQLGFWSIYFDLWVLELVGLPSRVAWRLRHSLSSGRVTHLTGQLTGPSVSSLLHFWFKMVQLGVCRLVLSDVFATQWAESKFSSEFPSSSFFGITGFPLFHWLYLKLACRFPRRGSSRQHEKSSAFHRRVQEI